MKIFVIIVSYVTFLDSLVHCQVRNIFPVIVTAIEEGSVVYETTSKLLFRLPIPQRTSNELLSTGVASCPQPAVSSGTWCPIHHHLQRSTAAMHSWVTPSKLAGKHSARPHQLTYDQMCDEIMKHFTSFNTLDSVLDTYVSSLRECDAPILLSSIDFTPPNIAQNYRQAMTDYSTNYWLAPFEPYESVGHALASASLISSTVVHHLAEKLMWSDAMASCAGGTIPDLISAANLNSELQDLLLNVVAEGYHFSIPNDAQSFGLYYKLPLTDCTIFNTANELLVRILVPLIRPTSDWRAVSASSVPFRHLYQTKVFYCFLPEYEIPRRIVYNSADFASSNAYYNYSCASTEGINLCKVPTSRSARSRQTTWRKTCLQIMLSSSPSHADIAKFCSLSCEAEGDVNLPFVSQPTPNDIYIAGNPTVDIRVRCTNEIERITFPPDEGAIHIVIPCNCYIISGPFLEIRPWLPCTNKPFSTEFVAPVNFQFTA